MPCYVRKALLLALLFTSAGWAGTGSAEDPTSPSLDADYALRASVRWILAIPGLVVKETERTVDLNLYQLDDKSAGASLSKQITDGLQKRQWKVKSREESQARIVEATKDDKKLKVTMRKAGKGPRTTVEIRKTK